MSNSDVTPETPRAAPAANKPSLMGEAVNAPATPKSPDKNTRMLRELESMNGQRAQGPARKLTLWFGAAALVAAAGAAWWSQQSAVKTPRPSPSGQAVVVPVKAPAALPVAQVAENNQAAASPAAPARSSMDIAPSVARIETASAATAAAVPAVTTLALAGAVAAPAVALNAAAPNISAPPKSVAAAAQPSAKTRVAKTSKTAKSTKTAKQQRQAKQQLAKAKKGQQGSAAPTRLAKATATGVLAAAPPAAGAGKDADILLLSALLAHVSRDGQAAPTSAPTVAQAQQTIAQVVQRCEARGGKDSAETIECRRRICDGYWGKAQACPVNLAPKKE